MIKAELPPISSDDLHKRANLVVSGTISEITSEIRPLNGHEEEYFTATFKLSGICKNKSGN